MNTIPEDVWPRIVCFMDAKTKRMMRLTSTVWFNIIKYNDFTLYLTKQEDLPTIVERLSKYSWPIKLTFNKHKFTDKVEIINHVKNLTNLVELTASLQNLGYSNQPRVAEWMQLSTLTNIERWRFMNEITPCDLIKSFKKLEEWHFYGGEDEHSPGQEALPLLTDLHALSFHESTHTWPFGLLQNPEKLTLLSMGISRTFKNEDIHMWSRLTNLKSLYCREDFSKNQIDIEHLTSLEECHLKCNSLPVFPMATNMTFLVVECKHWPQHSLDSIANLKMLQKFRLVYDKPLDQISLRFLAQLPNLTELQLQSSDGSEPAPIDMHHAIPTTLKTLHLHSEVHLNVAHLTHLVNLEKLDCEFGLLDGIEYLDRLSRLTFLQLANLNESCDIRSIEQLTRLEELSISGEIQAENQLIRVDRLTALKRLKWQMENRPSEVTDSIKKLTDLEQLIFSRSTQHHVDYSFFSEMSKLTLLDVTDHLLKDRSLWNNIVRLTDLKNLFLDVNLTDDDILALTALSCLSKLYIVNTPSHFNGCHLTALTSVQSLDVFGNGLLRYSKKDFLDRLPNLYYYDGNEIEEEDESKSVSRFKSLENSPPSLSSLCIFSISSWMNETTCDTNNTNVQNELCRRIQALPVDLRHKIETQLSLTALRCIYQHRVWDLDPHIIAAGIKQEEDMLRYLFWKQPNNPLLKHFEKTLVINLFDEKRLSQFIGNTKLRPNIQMKQAHVQAYINECFDISYANSKKEFKANFKQLTHGCMRNINWKNVLVVGGSVLKSLRKDKRHNAEAMTSRDNLLYPTDIDIYIYGLTPEKAQTKVEEIFNTIQSRWNEKIGILKTANTITMLSNRKFRKVQIILSTYASPLEILLASDMNSCSSKMTLLINGDILNPTININIDIFLRILMPIFTVGFNGDTVLVIPRFLFGAIYGSNFLDSSTKFGTKLRWERITKYYGRGYNFIAPLHLRVHGTGSLDVSEKIDPHVHPTTYQMIELMCLMKVVLLRIILHEETHLDIYGWKYAWAQGFCITFRKTRWYTSDYANLHEVFPTMPVWVKNYYTTRQSLRWLKTGVREPPKYAENASIQTIEHLHWSDTPEKNFNPSTTTDIHQYVQDNCKFDKYNDSALQCFHLNFFVDKEQTALNPYREMNTTLMTLKYRLETAQLTFTDFNAFLNGQFQELTKTLKLHGYNWQLKLSFGSGAVSFITLTKELDDDDQHNNNDLGYIPTKFFANFFIKIKNQKAIKNGERPKDLILDGSQVFTYNEPDNMWLTWVHNKYIKGILPTFDHYELVDLPNEDLLFIVDGTTHWEVVMQLIEPRL